MPDEEWDFPRFEIAGREFAILQLAAIAGGTGLAGSYFLPWVAIVGTVNVVDDETNTLTGEVVEEGMIMAGEIIAIYPTLVSFLGAVAVFASVLWWNRAIHILVMFVGVVGTGIGLFMREAIRVDGEQGIRVADYTGPASAFEPASGMWLAIGLSALLIGIGFGAFLNTFEPIEDEPIEEDAVDEENVEEEAV